jgi:hypothetical protein
MADLRDVLDDLGFLIDRSERCGMEALINSWQTTKPTMLSPIGSP